MVELGYRSFISGGAFGIDQYFAESVLICRTFTPNIELIVAKPFPSQDSRWPAKSQKRFSEICNAASSVINVSDDPYSPAKMQTRNKWMVNHSSLVLAVWSGKEHGGTWNCIQYARAQGKNIYHLNPITLETKNL
jgi:uncharacterized phage-like protein YoqJ